MRAFTGQADSEAPDQKSVLDQVTQGLPPGLFPDEEEETKAPEADAEEDEPKAAKDEDDEGQDESLEAEDEKQADTDEDTESDEEDTEPVAELIEVGGEKLSLDELKQGFLRTQDYTRKTMKLAQQRREFEQQSGEFGALMQAQKGQAMQEVQRYQAVPWQQLQAEDQARYEALRGQFQQAYQKAQAAEQQEQQFIQRYRQARDEMVKKQAEEARGELEKTLPGGWSEETYSGLRQHATAQGLDQTIFDQITNPALMRIMWQSRQFEMGKQKLQQPGNGAERGRKRKPAQVGTKAPKTKLARSRKRQDRLLAQARKTGNRDDMATYMETILPPEITDD